MADTNLESHLGVYSEWRAGLVDSIGDYRNWLNEQDLTRRKSISVSIHY